MSRHTKKHVPDPAIPADMRRAYHTLVTVLAAAHADAEMASVSSGQAARDLLDLTQVYRVIETHPDLANYLQAVQQRSMALRQAQQQSHEAAAAGGRLTDPFLKGFGATSPTTSNPRDSGKNGMFSSHNQPNGVANPRLLRDWADRNEWVRAAINARRTRIGRSMIAVGPLDESRPYNKTIQQRVQRLLRDPNEYRQNWAEFIGGVTEDILVLDRGVISKAMNLKREPVALYNEDAATIKIYPDWNGDPNVPRYLYEDPNRQRKVPLRNDECIMIMANAASYRYGLSPVQVLRDTIQADLRATASAMHLVDMKPPPHMIQIPKAKATAIEQFREKYDSEVAGRKEIFWIGGDEPAHVFPLVFSSKDMQWLEWQEYLARKIATVFQISPQQLGLTFDINKSTSVSQQEIAEDTGLIPLMLVIETYLNREVLADFATLYPDGRPNMDALNLQIYFPEITAYDRQMHAQENVEMGIKALAGLPSMTVNEVRLSRGDTEIPGGDALYVMTANGPIIWLPQPYPLPASVGNPVTGDHRSARVHPTNRQAGIARSY